LEKVLKSAADALNLSNVNLATHRRAGEQTQVKWSKKTQQLAFEFYKTDFEKFDYDPKIHTDNIKLNTWMSK